jgi:Rad3-related DNA helicase
MAAAATELCLAWPKTAAQLRVWSPIHTHTHMYIFISGLFTQEGDRGSTVVKVCATNLKVAVSIPDGFIGFFL